MDVFVAGKSNAEIRRAGFKDRLVEVVPAQPVLAFHVKEAAEVHEEDGRVTRAFAGDFIVEWPDGTVRALARDTFLELFVDPEAAEQVEAPAEPEPDPSIVPPVSRPADTEPEPFVDDTETTEDGELSPQEQAAQAVEKAEAQIREWATAARKQELISDAEAAEWEQTGELPDGVEVTPDGDGNWLIARKGAADLAVGEAVEGADEGHDELQGS